MNKRKHTKLVHEGKFVAEVAIEIIDTNDGWSPYISLEDALKLDTVREALRKKDIIRAARHSTVYEMSRIRVA